LTKKNRILTKRRIFAVCVAVSLVLLDIIQKIIGK